MTAIGVNELVNNNHSAAVQTRSEAPFYRAIGDEVEVFRGGRPAAGCRCC